MVTNGYPCGPKWIKSRYWFYSDIIADREY